MDAPRSREGTYHVRVGDLKRRASRTPLRPDLHECGYGGFTSSQMIKKVPLADLPSNFDYLCSLRHSSMLAVHDFFVDSDGKGCVVVESADETFEGWVLGANEEDLFIRSSNEYRLSPILRDMFLELASLVDKLLKENCYPDGLSIQDLYIKNKIEGGRPTLKVLLHHNVIPSASSRTAVPVTWTAVQDIIDKCCQLRGVNLDVTTTSFKKYFGHHKSAMDLKCYPDSWTDEEKKSYILMIISGDKTAMTNAIITSKVEWPLDPTVPNTNTVLPVLIDIATHHVRHHQVGPYETNGWGYIRLCRNVLKSFKIPLKWKADIQSNIAFMRKMEEWNPKIWTSLYESIGFLEGGKLNC